jgi:hypothetical protein
MAEFALFHIKTGLCIVVLVLVTYRQSPLLCINHFFRTKSRLGVHHAPYGLGNTNYAVRHNRLVATQKMLLIPIAWRVDAVFFQQLLDSTCGNDIPDLNVPGCLDRL